jgi:hypothetical protein
MSARARNIGLCLRAFVEDGTVFQVTFEGRGPVSALKAYIRNQPPRLRRRSFDPSPQLITPIVTVFDGLALPFVAVAQRLMA